METFLQQVIDHYFSSASTKLFVFPNRRSQIFFRKYFKEKMLSEGVETMLMPQITTISDLFRLFYRKGVVADEITLLVELYEAYRKVKEEKAAAEGREVDIESLDDFLFWGGVILNDFNDIDKYLADPTQLLRNISELKDIQADIESYTDKGQFEAIMKLVRSIHPAHGGEDKEFHKRFSALWDLLLPVYKNYNAALSSKGLAYEGMIARSVAENPAETVDIVKERYPNVKKLVFVGLNALTAAEKELLRHFRDRGFAEFCWDYPSLAADSPLLADKANKASLFISSYLRKDDKYHFPQAFPLRYGSGAEISVVTTSTNVAQSKLIPQFLSGVDGKIDEKTLILLPDEGQLQSVLTSIPSEVGTINVTMGFPLSLSQVFSLITSLLALFESKRPGYFYHKTVWDIMSSSLFRLAHGDDGKIDKIKKEAKVYIPAEDLAFSPLFVLPKNVSSWSEAADCLLKSLDFVGTNLPQEKVLERQAVYETYKVVKDLARQHLERRYPDLSLATFKSLLLKLISRVLIPYHGEPVTGLQVMGPLEVRALDFENIMILSAGEDIFPRKNVAETFIPHNIRRAFGLPTYEHQDAIWAYYFYRLLSRAKRVWLVYNNVASGISTGEPSRYIMQLKYGYTDLCKMDFYNAEVTSRVSSEYNSYPNTEPYSGDFSATLVQKYLSCPLAFYYRYVKGIHDDPNEVSEDVESNVFGTIVHETMCELYKPFEGKSISAQEIRALQKNKDELLKKHFYRQLHIDSFEGNGKTFISYGIARKYVENILCADEDLAIKNGGSFRILELEKSLFADLCGHRVCGKLDRVDMVGGKLRIVDYKTGKYFKEDIEPQETTPQAAFDPSRSKDWPKIAIQLFLYDYLWYCNYPQYGVKNPVVNVIYCPYKLVSQVEGTSPLPNAGVIAEEIYEDFKERFEATIRQIADPQTTFTHTAYRKACEYCKYVTLCRK